MKGDIEVDMPVASVSVQAAGQQKKKTLQKLNAGNVMTHKVMGQEVSFKLEKITAEHIDKKTMVWGGNERNQSFLDEMAVADLMDSFLDKGQQVPAFGRNVNGIIEVADGSRRRKTALLVGTDYFVWVGELTDKQMQYLSDVGNQYKPISAYERGNTYRALLDSGMSQDAVCEKVGVTRKAMMRCVYTNKLSSSIIKSLKSPNDLSARKGEELFRIYDSLDNQNQFEVDEYCLTTLLPNKGTTESEKTIKLIEDKCLSFISKPKKIEKTVSKVGKTAKLTRKGNKARFDITTENEQLLKQIQQVILDFEALESF